MDSAIGNRSLARALADNQPDPFGIACSTRRRTCCFESCSSVHDDAQVQGMLDGVDSDRHCVRSDVPVEGVGAHSGALRNLHLTRNQGALRLDPIFRPDLTRVVITGSESTGKTTLARTLAARFHTIYVPEFVREFALSRGAPIDFRDHGTIARGQIALENEAAARAPGLLLQDTDLVSTVVYCEHYFGRCPQFIIDTAVERRGALYLLLSPDVPWIADGVRDRGDRRSEMHKLFTTRLMELGMPVVEIAGDYATRTERAAAEITSLLAQLRS